MTHKEIERQNFVLWYGFYVTEKELEIARTSNKEVLDRLLREYAEEVDKIDKSKRSHGWVAQSKNARTQGSDAILRIDYLCQQRNSDVLENVPNGL
ncbi:MAG: hypothetical protein KGJ87_02610 [Planctomycetota bacterium]|nr:hypothetical protein [Planctomycetota bacterium]MDE1889925.1 hypothetical protein [Planctomycetota bacterium]MDE2216043.1 hypothetical protein [Planctomycetota bacterium]